MSMYANPEVTPEAALFVFLLLVVAILYMHYSWRREKNKLIQATAELLEHRVKQIDLKERTDLTQRLHRAARAGDTREITRAIHLNADVNASDPNTAATPLYVAAQQGHIDAVELVLARGANVDAANKHGMTALIASVKSAAVTPKCRRCVEKLLGSSANPNAATVDGDTALLSACRARDVECIDMLLKHGASPAHANDKGETAASLVAGDENLASKLATALESAPAAAMEQEESVKLRRRAPATDS